MYKRGRVGDPLIGYISPLISPEFTTEWRTPCSASIAGTSKAAATATTSTGAAAIAPSGFRAPFAIKEFDRLDPQSMTFRYMLKKNGRSNIDRSFLFSANEFANVIDPILEHLFNMIELADEIVTDALESR